MSDAVHKTLASEHLRQRAVAKLTGGLPPGAQRAGAHEALSVLHHLASSPSTAADALTLLHEMQVYQVELDLQREELRSSRIELETALRQQTARIEQAPAGFITIDSKTVVCEANAAAARMLGKVPDELPGLPFATLLAPRGAESLQSLMAKARAGLLRQTCELQLLPLQGAARSLVAAVSPGPQSGLFMLVMLEAPPTGLSSAVNHEG